jgi:hypothetical protein
MFRMREISITRLGVFKRDKINMVESFVQIFGAAIHAVFKCNNPRDLVFQRLESLCYFGDLAGGRAALVLKDNDMLHQVSFRQSFGFAARKLLQVTLPISFPGARSSRLSKR